MMTLKAKGFDDAIIGTARVKGEDVFVYDYDFCIKILKSRDNSSHQDSVEWMEHNVISSWMGAGTPIFVERCGFD
jgi:hypothetical protein